MPPFDQSTTKEWLFRNSSYKNDSIILTPRQPGKWGSIWNRIKTTTNSWKIVLKYSAYNDQVQIADGIAFWYVPESSQWTYQATHHAYGGPSRNFTGLMIVMDNYKLPSNLSLTRTKSQAALVVVHNENPRFYDWVNEGYDTMVGRCLVNNRYRNTTNTLATLAVEYVDEVLKVYHTNESEVLELCVEAHGLKIPSGYIIGISAGNGLIIGAYKIHSLMYYDDKRCDCAERTGKLWIYIYAISSLLILITFILIVILIKYLTNIRYKKEKMHKQETLDTNETVTTSGKKKPCTSPRRANNKKRFDKRIENNTVHPSRARFLPLPKRFLDRDSTNYVDVGGHVPDTTYDHLKFTS